MSVQKKCGTSRGQPLCEEDTTVDSGTVPPGSTHAGDPTDHDNANVGYADGGPEPGTNQDLDYLPSETEPTANVTDAPASSDSTSMGTTDTLLEDDNSNETDSDMGAPIGAGTDTETLPSSETPTTPDAHSATDTFNEPSFPEDRPNILLIVADDQGYHDVGVYGATDIATPTIDKLASEGIRFTTFYAGSNVCTTSRGTLMTGSYGPRVGFSRGGPGNVIFPDDEEGINPDEKTIAEALKEVGYSTGIIGKWHLGHHPPFLPTRHGFDFYYGIPYSNNMTPLYILENETVVEEDPPQETITQKYTEKALAFLDENHVAPFFLYVAHTMPHYPVAASPNFSGRSTYGPYGDAVEEIDWSTDQLLQKLDALNLTDNTLVIYTSDNGGEIERNSQMLGRNTPLRGRKAENWEGGLRVPCIMRWPEKLPQGGVVDEVVSFMDLYPTLARLTGATVPTDRVIDGLDMWPVIAEGALSPREYFFYSLRTVRSRQWKLLNGWLFDLVNDIGETTDLASLYPEIASELQAELDAKNAEINRNVRPLAKLSDFPEEEQQPRP